MFVHLEIEMNCGSQRYAAFFIKRKELRGNKKEGLEAGFWRDCSLNEGLILQ